MFARQFVKFGCFFPTLAVVALTYLHAQTPPLPGTGLQEFYQSLVQNPSSPPVYENLRKVTGQVGKLRPEEIIKALPAIFAALAHQDNTVSGYADSALFSIALRPDSAALLRGHVDAIAHELTSPTQERRAAAMVILGTLNPVPPPEVVPILVTFLKRTDADAQAQGSSAIFELVRIAPENPEVIAAVRDFLSRPLDNKSRRETLVAVGKPTVKDAQIVAMMIGSLDDSDAGVRITAVQALSGMGQQALQQAEPALQRLANDPDQPADMRTAAKDALQKLRPSRQ
jgi:HEAT repeat protein